MREELSPRFDKRPQPSPDDPASALRGDKKRPKSNEGGIVNQALNNEAKRLKHVADSLRNSDDVCGTTHTRTRTRHRTHGTTCLTF